MARGGSRGRRSYARDARGRFASTGTTGRKAKPARTTFRQRQAVDLAKKRGQTGYLGSATRTAKARLKASKAKVTPGASRQQKAAVTRAQRMAAALAGQRRIKTATQAGVLRGAAAGKVQKAVGARVRPGLTSKGRASSAAKPTPKAAPKVSRGSTPKRSTAAARGERILARFLSIGEGRTGRKLRQSQIVKDRAGRFLSLLAPSGSYERGANAGRERPRSEILTGLVKNLMNKDKVKAAKRIVGRAPASGIRQRINQQRGRAGNYDARRRGRLDIRAARSGLGMMSDSAYRQSLGYSGTRPKNKIDTSVEVRRRAMEFLASPRSGQRLPGLSRPAPQRKPTTTEPKPVAPTPKGEGVKATEMQRARRKEAERRYGVKQTRNSARFGIKGRRGMSQIRRAASRRLLRRLDDVKGRKFVGSTHRGNVYSFPVNQQMNIFGGIDRARATRGRKIGTRKPGTRKIDRTARR